MLITYTTSLGVGSRFLAVPGLDWLGQRGDHILSSAPEVNSSAPASTAWI